MNTKDRLWSLGAGLLAIGVAGGAWFGAISPDLSAATTARDDLETVEQQNSLHELRIANLEEAAARIGEFEASRDELAQALPSELQYAEFMRQLDTLAADAGVTLAGVTSSEALAYMPPVEAEAPPEPEPSSETEGGGESDAAADPAAEPAAGQAAVTPAEPAPTAAAPMPYADPLIGPENLAAVPVVISATGSTAALEAFLNEVQMGSRLISVSSATFGPDSGLIQGVDAELATEGDAEAQAPTSDLWEVAITGYLYVLQAEAAVSAP